MNDTSWSKTAPEGWTRKKLKYVADFVGGGTPDKSKPEFWNGEIPWVSPKDMKTDEILDTEDHITTEGLESSATNLVEPGAALIVVRSGILRHSIPVAVNRVPVALNQDMRAILPHESLEVGFLACLIRGFQTELLRQWSKEGATVESIEYDLMASTEIPLPPLDVQTGIVAYLDRETADIDALIAAKQRLLDLLAEKRRAIVAEAVMRGLNPAGPLRPSGVDWLGDIPAHWEVRRIATLFVQRDERSRPELPLLEVSINAGVIVREFSNDKIEGTASDFNTYKVARHGDIAFNKMRMWQGAVGVAPVDGLVSPDYTVAEAASCLRPAYAGLLFRTDSFSAECGRNSQGITWDRLRLYWDGFRDIFMPLPPLAEQDEILEAVQSETIKIDRLRAATRHSITRLRERRVALIAAAVTGQIDIPEAA